MKSKQIEKGKLLKLSDKICYYKRTDFDNKNIDEQLKVFDNQNNLEIIKKNFNNGSYTAEKISPSIAELLENSNEMDIIVKDFSRLTKYSSDVPTLMKKFAKKNKRIYSVKDDLYADEKFSNTKENINKDIEL